MSQNMSEIFKGLPSDVRVFLLKASVAVKRQKPDPVEIETLRKEYELLNKKYNIDGKALENAVNQSTIKKDTGSMMRRIAHKFNNKYWIDYTRAHRKAFQETERKLLGHNTKEGLKHDRDKEIMYHLFPAPIAHAIHVSMARHHKR